MDDQKDETPELAEAAEVSGMRKGGKTQVKHNSNLLNFPIHRRRSLFTLSERCHAWRSIRVPRGAYKTPFREDLR